MNEKLTYSNLKLKVCSTKTCGKFQSQGWYWDKDINLTVLTSDFSLDECDEKHL